MSQKPDEIIQGILNDAFDKYREGEKKHGVLDIDTDPRNFLREAENELLDAIVYMCIEVARLRRVNQLIVLERLELAAALELRGPKTPEESTL